MGLVILVSDARAETVSCEHLPSLVLPQASTLAPSVLLPQVPSVTVASPALLTLDLLTLGKSGWGMRHLTSEVLD